jgi:multiple sugar transport system substrate-binding protein
MMIQLLKQEGSDYSDYLGNTWLFDEVTKENLMEIASHAKTGAFSTFKISGYPANFLNAGQCIFAVDSTAGATWMGTNAPLCDIAADKIVDFETAVYPVPQYVDREGNVISHSKASDLATGEKRFAMMSQGPSICIFNKKDPQEVLASWLFVQYMLTNDVQIAYAETEGYVPVTAKAQNSAEYQDYLSRAGEDNSTYYDVKIQATKLLLENQQYTFVTSVFNGSTSLRDAAGQLIENVTKSVRRKTNVDSAYIDALYEDVQSLYHLDQTSVVGGGKVQLGELPNESKWLIRILITTWIIIGFYIFRTKILK